MSKAATKTTTNDIPTTTMTGNAKKLEELQKQLEAIQQEAAEVTASEVYNVLKDAEKKAEQSKAKEMPTPVSHYLTARLASACFMALRDELVSSYMRLESVQNDRAIIEQRKREGSFRSDVEAAAAERSLAYYENLQERFDEVCSLISDVVHVHKLACDAQFVEDEARQQDIPPDERTYVSMPQLRWVSNADKQAHPDDWEKRNDLQRMAQQARFWLSFNTSTSSAS